jgi:hypothetical protein
MEWGQRLGGDHLISGIPPSELKETEINKLVEGMLERKSLFGKSLEYVAGRRTVWMPYYRIRMEYLKSISEPIGRTGERVPVETALNAMFCGCVSSESELLMIFRPNYLRYEAVPIVPVADEVVGSACRADSEEILSGLVKKLNETQDKLSELRSTLSRSYVRKRRYQMLLPMGNLREEKDLSARIASLDALKNTISLCLNIDGEVGSIEVLGDDTFYYPTSVFLVKDRESENQRFLIVNLVKTGGILQRPNCDILLTQLCNNNHECKKLVAAAMGLTFA